MHPLTILIPSCYGLHPEKKAMGNQNCAIRWKGGVCPMDLDFLDNITMLVDTRGDLQSMKTNLGREASMIGLRFNSEKMKVMIIG